MARYSPKDSARTLWRTISTNLLDADHRAALFVSADGDEGETESAVLACRAAVAEGFNACLVVAGNDRAAAALLRTHDGSDIAATIHVGGHELQIIRGRPGGPDILHLKLESALLRDLVTHARGPESNIGDLRDQLLARLEELYEIAVILGGSVLIDPYSLIFADRVPGVVLVLRSAHTRLQDLGRAKSLIEAAGGAILGTVMTQRKFYVPAWLDRRL